MAIRQMNRDGFAQPEVRTTDYGAKYVTASKERKGEDKEPVVLEPEKKEKPLVSDENDGVKPVDKQPEPAPVVKEKKEKPAKAAAKPKGRPKKK